MSSNSEYEQRRCFDEVRPLTSKTKKAVAIIERIPLMQHYYMVDQCAKGKMTFYDWLISFNGKRIDCYMYEAKLLWKLRKFIFND